MNNQTALIPITTDILDNIQTFSGVPQQALPQPVQAQGQHFSQQTLKRVQTEYTTAMSVQKPRSLTKVVHNVLEEAKLAGASFYYRWAQYDKTKKREVPVEGPSIDLAMALARSYGNCVLAVEAEENPDHFMIKGIFIDLESGFTCPRLYRQRKGQNLGGGMGDERKADIAFQIGQSKAQRNAIIKAMPAWLVDRAIEVAKEAELNRVQPENIVLSRQKVLDFFAQYGVAQERIEAKMHKKADEWGPSDIADLRGSATALREGRISANELFPVVEEPQGKAQPDEDKTETRAAPSSKNSAKSGPARMAKRGKAVEEDLLGTSEAQAREGVEMKSCPNREGEFVEVAYCDTQCTNRKGCPEFE